MFFELVQFYLPMIQIMVMNMTKKIETILKVLHQN